MLDFTDALKNLTESYPSIYHLLTSISLVLGMLMIFRAIYYLKVYGELRTMMASQSNLKEPILFFLVGCFFVYLPTAFHVVMMTTYGYDNMKPLDYVTSNHHLYDMGLGALFGIIRIMGFISFIRGWRVFAQASQQHSRHTFGKGLTHILAGVFAMNVAGTKMILWHTLGFS